MTSNTLTAATLMVSMATSTTAQSPADIANANKKGRCRAALFNAVPTDPAISARPKGRTPAA